MQDSVIKIIVGGGFALATVVWLVRNREAASQLSTISKRPTTAFSPSTRAYKIASIASAASWLLIPISFWAPNSQVWSAAGGLLVSFSMLVQLRAEGRKPWAKISLWTTAISGVCFFVIPLMVMFEHAGDAATASMGSIGKGSSPRLMVGPHDHSPSPIPDSGATPRQ